MPRATPYLNTFNGGEFTPLLDGRVDIDKYTSACRQMSNFMPLVQGAARKRSGFRFVRGVKASANRTALLPFEFSTTQAYILEFGNLYMRVFKDNGQVLEGSKTITGTTNATPVVVTTSAAHGYTTGDEVFIASTGKATLDNRYWPIIVLSGTTFSLTGSTAPGSTSATGTAGRVYQIVTPYASSDLEELYFAQSDDTLYLAHPRFAPRKLTRSAHTSWTITTVAFDWFPFAPENQDETLTITVNGTTTVGASVTLTASSAMFTPSSVGTYIKLRDDFEVYHPPWKEVINYSAGAEYVSFISGASISVGDRVHNDGKVYELTTKNGNVATGRVGPTHERGTEKDGSYSWLFINYGYGYALVTAYTSVTVVTATVVKALPKRPAGNYANFRFSFGAWSDTRGYPKAVTFFEDRLIWASTESDPQSMWFSRTSRYEDHRATDQDDSAMLVTLNSATVNVITWLEEQDGVLQIGTVGGEWSPSKSEDPLTPSNVAARIKQRSAYGSRERVLPASVENVVLFAQRSGRKLRELVPANQIDSSSNEYPDLSVLAEHATVGLIKEMAFQSEPERILWVIMDDGGLWGVTYDRAQQVVAWHEHPVGGTSVVVESIASIPHPDGDRDQLWAIIRRSINGSTVRYIEYLEAGWVRGTAIADSFYVDSGLTYDSTPATTISGLDHLVAETVAVLADGLYIGTKTVSASGTITLTTAASTVQAGLPFSGTLEPMKIEAGGGDGPAQGKTKRVHQLVARLDETGKGLYCGPTTARATEEVVDMEDDQTLDAGELFTGDSRPLPFPGGYSQAGRVVLVHSTPLPCTILALQPKLSTQDG